MSDQEYDSTRDTMAHIREVRAIMAEVIMDLQIRSKNHDAFLNTLPLLEDNRA